jgi:hypothetical protein
MSKEIFEEHNEELQEQFNAYENWADVEKIIDAGDADNAGIAANNGVLCWYTEGYAGFAADTPENREIAVAQREEAMAEIEKN